MRVLALVLICVTLYGVMSIERVKCETSHMISCTMQIQKAVKKCSSVNNVKECVDQLLQNSVCLSCLCDIVPAVCFDEEKADVEQQNQIDSLNNVLHEVAECGQIEKYKCQNIIKKTVKQCSSKDCILGQLKERKCHMCLCEVDRDTCKKYNLTNDNLIQDSSKTITQDNIDDSPFQSFENLLSMIPAHLKDKKKEDETKNRLDSLIDLGVNFFQQQNIDPADLLKGLEESSIQAATDNHEVRENQMSLINRLINSNDSGFASIQQELMKNKNFQDIQQKMIQKVMANPQILTKLIEQLSGQAPDIDTLNNLLGSDILKSIQNLENDET